MTRFAHRPASKDSIPGGTGLIRALLASTALVGVGFAPTLAAAQALPTGGRVVSGGATIGAPSGGAMSITQSSQNAIVNWQGFSIGQANRVDIVQPNASSAILNRVTGDTPSTIAGQLNANGQVYLVNPNGITITRSGQVNAAGFVASTLDISDEDFKAGRRQFRGTGTSAAVTNRGTITIGRGGYAALIGGKVANSGTISVPLGKVGLGSGERATLDLSGDGFLQVAVPTSAKGKGALVRQSGIISANGGSVTLTAAAARNMAREAVNLSGTIEARSVSGRNGSIVLSGGNGAVRVTSSGRLDASGAGGQRGGRIKVAGAKVDLGGTVDVSGSRGGRVALRATDRLTVSGRVEARGHVGKGGHITATAPAIATRAATIAASGASGGGTILVGGGYQGTGKLRHADTVDIDAGTTLKADATRAGDGGEVVIWSDRATRFAGTITARGGAQGGAGGQAEVSSHGLLGYAGFTDLTAAHGRFGTLLLDPYNVTISNAPGAGNDSVINATLLQSQLGSANITVSTGAAGSAGTQAGNITVAAPITWNAPTLLTLSAANAIAVNAPITVAGGGQLALSTAMTTTDVASAQPLLSFGTGASVTFAANPNQSTQALTINGNAYTLIRSMADVAVLNNQSGAYALANNLDASGTTYTGAVTDSFSGTLEGLGHTIAGLTIKAPTTDSVGLIGYLAFGSTVRDLGLLGGSVSGRSYVGGLVGQNSGTVSQSYATVAVSGSSNSGFSVGGLVGTNNYSGTVSQSYATGAVSSYGNVGGLVGANQGTVSRSYATGAVGGGANNNVGGLVGTNQGTVSQSYATGAVSGQVDLGGLVGWTIGTVSQSYATGAVTGGDYVGGLVGINAGTVSQSYATGAVSGTSNVGGLVGQNYNATITASVWDKETSGTNAGIGTDNSNQSVSPYTTRQMQGLDPISGSVAGGNAVYFSAAVQLGDGTSSAFSGGANGLYPYLTKFFPGGVQAITGTAQDSNGVPLSGAQVGLYAGGNLLGGGLVSAGANGYVYQIVAAGTLPGSAPARIGASLTPPGGSAATGLLYTDAASFAGPILTLGAVTAGQNRQMTARTSYSGLQGDLAATFGAGSLSTLTGALTSTPLSITATGAGFTLDQALTTSADVNLATTDTGAALILAANVDVGTATLTLSSASTLIQTAGTITAGTLNGASGGDASLAPGSNAIRTLGNFAAAGSMALFTDQPLTLAGTVSGGGSVSLVSSGTLTLASGAQVRAGRDAVLAATGAFLNNAGSGAVASSGGRWLVYSANSAGDSFGGLDSGNTAVWNTATGASVAQTGNRYAFAEQPTLAITTTDVTKTYGQDATAAVAGAYTLTGLRPGVAGAYLADTAATALAGTPVVTSLGSAANADVTGLPYTISAALTGLTSSAGYALVASNAGHLTVTPATLTVAGASGVGKTYDGTTALPANAAGFTVSGVLFGDAVDVTAASAGYDSAGVGSRAVLVSGLSLAGAKAGNYVLSTSAVTGSGTIDPAALTITAADRTKIYGGTLSLGTTGFTASGLFGADTVTGVNLTSAGAAATASVAGGPYAIIAANAQGTGLANYAITYAPGTLTVNPAAVTVTALGGRSTYGTSPANPGLSATGLQNGEDVGVLTGLSNGFGIGATTAAGHYATTVAGTLANPNYVIAARIGKTWIVDPRPITVTADDQNRSYGNGNPPLTYTVGGLGLVNGDRLSGQLDTLAGQMSPPGVYMIDQGSLTASANYSLAFRPGLLTITSPETEVPLPSPALVASTLDRSLRQNQATPSKQAMQASASVSEAGGSVDLIADPRFDEIVVCSDSRPDRDCVVVPVSQAKPRSKR